MGYHIYVQIFLGIIIIRKIFSAYGITISLNLEKLSWDEEEKYYFDSNVRECFSSIDKSLYNRLGWSMEEISVPPGDILQEEINQCLERLPDGGEEQFNLCREVVARLDETDDIVGYFGILYYPGMEALGAWLAQSKANRDLLELYKLCRRNVEDILNLYYIGYTPFSVNGTLYIPIVYGESNTDPMYSVDAEHFNITTLFDLYALHQVFLIAKGRGFDERKRMGGLQAAVSDCRQLYRISYEKYRRGCSAV